MLSFCQAAFWPLLAVPRSPDRHFELLHESLLWSHPTNWSPTTVDELCKTLAERPPEDLRMNQSDPVFHYNSDSERRGHYHLAMRCCDETRMMDRLPCFADLRRSFIDRYCHHRGSQHPCCKMEGQQRYKCFVRRYEDENSREEVMLDNRVSARRLGTDDPERATDNTGKSSGNVDRPSSNEVDKAGAEDSELLLSAIEELDSEEGEYCMQNYFPESDLDRLSSEAVSREMCPSTGFATSGCEAKACCKAGALEGKRLEKKHCPYYQCRAFYKTFYNHHRTCIKHKLFCGFFFIACCERQYHKDFYRLDNSNGAFRVG